MSTVSVTDGVEPLQIGFLTEWQMYAQKIEGDSCGERLDGGKIDKMSGMRLLSSGLPLLIGLIQFRRPAVGPVIRAYASYTEQGTWRR